MVRIEQGRAAYGQDWTCRNLSVIPLGTEVMDASLPLWIANRLLTSLRRASRALPCAEGSGVWSGGQGEGERRTLSRVANPGRVRTLEASAQVVERYTHQT